MATTTSFDKALAFYRDGRVAEAEAICSALIEDDPNHFGALALLGGIALRSGRDETAVELLSRAVEVNPKAAKSYKTLGDAFKRLNKNKEALESFDKALALDPEIVEAWVNKSQILLEEGRFEDALPCLDRLIALRPGFLPGWFNRANILILLGRTEDAIADLEKALSLDPNLARAWDQRGALLLESNRPDEAFASFEKAVTLSPETASVHYNRGNALRELNRLDDAIASYDAALARNPYLSEAITNRAICLLMKGQWKDAWPAYEHRDRMNSRLLASPPWLGAEDIAGRTLFIHPELFMGDMIQLCRYAKCALERGARVVLAAPHSLHALLGTLDPRIELIGADDTPAHFDVHTPLMSLPFAFKTELASVPATAPYLRADPVRVAAWKARLTERGFFVGACWRGRQTNNAQRLNRSIPAEHFRRIAALPRVRLVNLQKIDEQDPATKPPSDLSIVDFGADLDPGPDAFLDTAALMASLDLVITADTAIAHLAGALARPTWLLLPQVADWRWLMGRSDSPWYPTLRLFRQKTRGDWGAVFAEVEAALAECFAFTTANAQAPAAARPGP